MKRLIWMGGLVCVTAGCDDEPIACAMTEPRSETLGVCLRRPRGAPADAEVEITAIGDGAIEPAGGCADRFGALGEKTRWFRAVDAEGEEWTVEYDLPGAPPFVVGETVMLSVRTEYGVGFFMDLPTGYLAISDADGLRAFIAAGHQDFAEIGTATTELTFERGDAVCEQQRECGYTGYDVVATTADGQARIGLEETAPAGEFTVVHMGLLDGPIKSSQISCNGAPEDFAIGAWRTP